MAGFSIDSGGNLRAVVWKHYRPADLNTLVPDSPLYLLQGSSINDRGEIVGFGIDTESGDLHAFLASLITGRGVCARDAVKPPVLPERARAFVERQLRSYRAGN